MVKQTKRRKFLKPKKKLLPRVQELEAIKEFEFKFQKSSEQPQSLQIKSIQRKTTLSERKSFSIQAFEEPFIGKKNHFPEDIVRTKRFFSCMQETSGQFQKRKNKRLPIMVTRSSQKENSGHLTDEGILLS